jgi:hypothetical protein
MTKEPPALTALRRAGLTVARLADVSGVEPARTIAELAGRRRMSGATMDALRGLLSPHTAEGIGGLAGTSRAAYLEQVQAGRM